MPDFSELPIPYKTPNEAAAAIRDGIKVVSYDAQSLTAEQKSQARANIDAAAYDAGLNENGRLNIPAGGGIFFGAASAWLRSPDTDTLEIGVGWGQQEETPGAITIGPGGLVGIGTRVPTEGLEVAGNALIHGESNRMPNQTAETGDSVMTRITSEEEEMWRIATGYRILPISHTDGGGLSGTFGHISRSFVAAAVASSSCGPNYGSPFGGDYNVNGQTRRNQSLALAVVHVGLKYAGADLVVGVGLPDTLPAFGNPYLVDTGIGYAMTNSGMVLFAHNGTDYTQTDPVLITGWSDGRHTPIILTTNGAGRVRLFSVQTSDIFARPAATPILEIPAGGPTSPSNTVYYANNGHLRARIVKDDTPTSTVVMTIMAARTLINPSFA